MDRNFFLWYYADGLRQALALMGNAVRFVVFRFHIAALLATLVSPWKRDIELRTWRGLHPLKSLSAFFGNFISRFLGMIVRLGVILFGTVLLIGASIAVTVLFVTYALAPFLIVLGVVSFFVNPLLASGLLVSGAVGFLMALFGFVLRCQEEPRTDDVAVLGSRRWFPRVLARLGLEKRSFDASVLKDTGSLIEYLEDLGMSRSVFEDAVQREREAFERRDRESRFWLWENLEKRAPIGKGWHYAYTPHLDRYVLDLSKDDPTEYGWCELVGRQEEFRVGKLILERPVQNSFLLVGDPGLGKKTLVHYLARQIRENALAGSVLGDARVLVFDLARAVGDAMSQGLDPEHSLRPLFHEAAYAGNVILVIDNLDIYLGGDPTHANLAPVFAEYLALPTFRVIGIATTERYHTLAKTDEQALKFLETIYMREPTAEETLAILLDHYEKSERRRVVFTLPGLRSIVETAGRYNWDVPFPERALDLAQEVLLFFRERPEPFVMPDTVSTFISVKTGMPTGAIGVDEKEKLLHLEELLHERIVGQEEAVKQVAEAMRKARAGFGNDKKPLGSFLFLGPTGVGKTETVKAFAESYFGDEEKMIRLDMSEYQNPSAVEQLIGSRALGLQGTLTNAAKEKPFSILLLDELEKAYPKALDLFLQILDEGYVTDGFGERVSFRNMIIVATSNAGAPLIRTLVAEGIPLPDIRKQAIDRIVDDRVFRLEFLNRFDGVIFFAPLTGGELEQVTENQLSRFADRLKKEKNITVRFAPGVTQAVVTHGYEPEFGARSIYRYIEDTIEDTVVKKIIAGEIASGGEFLVSANELSNP